MPIQKRQCPLENVGYEVEGRGARHTLFSSTAVLQAGTSDTDQVLAVVAATGMHPPHLQVLPGRWQTVVCSMTICVHVCIPCLIAQNCFIAALQNMLAFCGCLLIRRELQVYTSSFHFCFIQPLVYNKNKGSSPGSHVCSPAPCRCRVDQAVLCTLIYHYIFIRHIPHTIYHTHIPLYTYILYHTTLIYHHRTHATKSLGNMMPYPQSFVCRNGIRWFLVCACSIGRP